MVMKCEKAQELILTDYMDAELGEEHRREVDEHMRVCAACREFGALAREKNVQLLANVRKEEPPAYLWEGIRERIASEAKERSGILPDTVKFIREALLSLVKIPRPVIAFAAAAIVIVAVMVVGPVTQRLAVNEYLDDQAAFIVRLGTDETNEIGIFDTDIKTGAESFL